MTETVYDALMKVKPDGLALGAWAEKAGFARNLFNDLRKHGNPKSETVDRLLDAIDVSRAQFEAVRAPPPLPEDADSAVADPFRVFRHERPRDVPVRGTPSCGEMEIEGEQVETVEMDLDEIVDFVRRPASIDGRKDVYAIYTQGFSMQHRFEPGDLAYVDGRKPPVIGDYVVVQLKRARGDEGDRVVSALLKRLVRQSADWIELEQFNPPLIFRVERRRVAAIHRIFTMNELAGI